MFIDDIHKKEKIEKIPDGVFDLTSIAGWIWEHKGEAPKVASDFNELRLPFNSCWFEYNLDIDVKIKSDNEKGYETRVDHNSYGILATLVVKKEKK